MSVSAAQLRALAALGLEGELLLRVVDVMEMRDASRDGPMTSAERSRNYRERKRHEKRHETSRDASVTVDKKKVPPHPPKEKLPSELPSGSSSGASGAPVYTDSRHELWGEGVPILQQLGVSEKSARSNIGRWLKHTHDDPQAVLGAIQRARDHRAHDAIPWITNALGTANGKRPHHPHRQSPASDFFAGIAEVAADLDRHSELAEPADQDIPPGRVNIEH